MLLIKVNNKESDLVNLQHDLDPLSAWSVSNDLCFQPTKCVNPRICRKHKVIEAGKDLSILISSDMTLKNHIARVVAKANEM